MNEQVPATLGPPIRIRSVEGADFERLRGFYSGLSAGSRRRRFLSSGTEVDAQAAAYYCRPDHLHREGFVAVTVGDKDPGIVGHLCLEPTGSRDAEVALAVADAEQRQGIGRLLMNEALHWARRHGIERLRATCAVDNAGILALFRALGRPIAFGPMAGGIQELSIDLSTDLRPQRIAA